MTMGALSMGDLEAKTETCAVRCLRDQGGEWTSSRKKAPLGGDTCKWEERPKHCPWGGKGETGPMLGEEQVISQRTGMGVMAKQPETSYCWGPISRRGRGRGTPWGSPKLHI